MNREGTFAFTYNNEFDYSKFNQSNKIIQNQAYTGKVAPGTI